MQADNSTYLLHAARRRSEAARMRAEETLRQVQEGGESISVAQFARSAQVSRSWLYTQTDLMERVRAVIRTAPAVTPRSVSAASEASLLRRLQVAHQRISQLSDDNQLLKDQLAAVYAQQRQARGALGR